MKTKFLIPLLPLLVLLAGCKEKPSGCVEYAPADANISWTDYNSVSNVVKYFRCHENTLNQHLGDTLMLIGYLRLSSILEIVDDTISSEDNRIMILPLYDAPYPYPIDTVRPCKMIAKLGVDKHDEEDCCEWTLLLKPYYIEYL